MVRKFRLEKKMLKVIIFKEFNEKYGFQNIREIESENQKGRRGDGREEREWKGRERRIKEGEGSEV